MTLLHDFGLQSRPSTYLILITAIRRWMHLEKVLAPASKTELFYVFFNGKKYLILHPVGLKFKACFLFDQSKMRPTGICKTSSHQQFSSDQINWKMSKQRLTKKYLFLHYYYLLDVIEKKFTLASRFEKLQGWFNLNL